MTSDDTHSSLPHTHSQTHTHTPCASTVSPNDYHTLHARLTYSTYTAYCYWQCNKHKMKKITHESKNIKQHKGTLSMSSPTCTTDQSHQLTLKIGETEGKRGRGVAESDLKKKLGYHIKLVQWIHLVSWFKTADGQTSGCLFWVISSILMNTEIVPQTCKLQNRG